jgi:two-component system NtrC family sensor kinase
MGYVELLDRIGPLNDQQKDFVRRVQASVQSITALVNDLLDLGRIESGFDTRKDVVALDGILRYTLDNLHKQILDKDIALTVDVPEGIMPVLGNPVRLRQVVDNLVGNAVKYTTEGGKINISMQIEGGQLIMAVTDTGVGIPLTDQPHIFEKFYRASNAPKGTPGTGLGLAIVKSIAERHGGKVWVESELGHGSIFHLQIPLVQPKQS